MVVVSSYQIWCTRLTCETMFRFRQEERMLVAKAGGVESTDLALLNISS